MCLSVCVSISVYLPVFSIIPSYANHLRFSLSLVQSNPTQTSVCLCLALSVRCRVCQCTSRSSYLRLSRSLHLSLQRRKAKAILWQSHQFRTDFLANGVILRSFHPLKDRIRPKIAMHSTPSSAHT